MRARTIGLFVMVGVVMACDGAEGARFFLSLDEVGSGGVRRMPIEAGLDQTVYVMARVNPGEEIPGMSLALHTDVPGVFTVDNVTVLNPRGLVIDEYRWDVVRVALGSTDTLLIKEFTGIQPGGGLRYSRLVIADLLNDPTFSQESGFVPVASFDLTVGTSGVGNLWLSAGPVGGVVVTNQAPFDLVGFGDDFAPNNLIIPSGNPDTIPGKIPEPTTLLLLTPALAVLLRRAR